MLDEDTKKELEYLRNEVASLRTEVASLRTQIQRQTLPTQVYGPLTVIGPGTIPPTNLPPPHWPAVWNPVCKSPYTSDSVK